MIRGVESESPQARHEYCVTDEVIPPQNHTFKIGYKVLVRELKTLCTNLLDGD